MKGLASHTNEIFERVSKLDSIKEYVLIGGTALALQINKRISEDLDFCKWKADSKVNNEVNWKVIENELSHRVGKLEKTDVLGFNQTNYVISGVKLSFYANQSNYSPVERPIKILNNIKVPDIETIGAMKLEVMLRRSKFRDYYDLYSILKEGVSLNRMVDKAVTYSGNLLNAKNICAFISNGENFKNDPNFQLLKPFYNVTQSEIASTVIEKLQKENPLELLKAIYNNDYKKVKGILNRSGEIVSQKHIKLIKEMKDAKIDISPKLEQLVKERFRFTNRNNSGL